MTDHENTERLAALFRQDRLAASLGVELTGWSGGSATARATPGPEHCNFAGTVHGGYLFSAADVVASVAANSWGRMSVALAIDIKYLSAARVGDLLICQAVEVGRSRSVSTYRVEVSREDRVVAAAMATTFRTEDWHFGADAWSDRWRADH